MARTRPRKPKAKPAPPKAGAAHGLALAPYLLALACMAGGWISFQADTIAGHTQIVDKNAIGGPFTLTDQYGHVRTEKDFRGKYLLVYFGYTFCPDVCPMTLGVIANAMNRLGPLADKIAPIFITLDPARDKPAVLKAYLDSFDPHFVGLTGSKESIAKVAHTYHVYYKDETLPGGGYAVSHSSAIYLMDRNGRFITHYDEDAGPDALASALRKVIL